jgi:hypothetical protein
LVYPKQADLSSSRIFGRTVFPKARGSWIVDVFFKHEDDGTAPKFALRLMQVVGAQAVPAGRSDP